MYLVCFFFFQAEDGIRDSKVTGVQTCALPISELIGTSSVSKPCHSPANICRLTSPCRRDTPFARCARRKPMCAMLNIPALLRSEERRGGEEGRSRWAPYHLKKKKKINYLRTDK